MSSDKLAINWQNFARVRLQFKFAFILQPIGIYSHLRHKERRQRKSNSKV